MIREEIEDMMIEDQKEKDQAKKIDDDGGP